ncbi:DUF1572 family protein [Taibaiella chishuiensis]|uniref:Uncharacterized protein DUF1572 n=1 Tax=Taibaiella chishuiensis TaxID=1434707 RepID=A0A2P8D5Z6_9BACT|nr:DUF1572 family protein [Taibaiella chishuiensis]PSK92611.1 uncharacterized protein DUF1572 [Taibaiella chishuiensis]
MNVSENFSAISAKMFHYYKSLGDKSLARLDDKEIHLRISGASNNVATIVKHMSGNMLSRFTDFLTSDGEKPWRKRDEEFDDTYSSKAEMMAAWEQGWACLFGALAAIPEAGLTDIVYIRNEGHTVLEAITRQVAHYAYHTGQIVMIAKAIRDEDWESLSIAKGASDAYNQDKFEQPQARRFFTDGKVAGSGA